VYQNVTQMERRDVHDIYQQIEALAKEAKKWTASIGGGLLTRTREDVRQMKDELRKERDERRREQEGLGDA
jgi:hypothetical protein